MPLITIGVPVYNGERYVEEALRSILSQESADLEVVISDNASTDRTRDICRSVAAADRRVLYVRNETNLGAAANYNRVVHLARGDYFKWSAHDDLLAPTFVRDCLAALEGDGSAVLSYPHAMVIDDEGDEAGPETMDEVVVQAGTPHDRLKEYLASSWDNPRCTAILGVMRTGVLRKTRLVEPYVSADRILLAELALHGKFLRVAGMLLKRRRHEGSSMRAHAAFEDRMRWFGGSGSKSVSSPHLLWLRKYASAIPFASLTPAESIRCLFAVGEYARKVWPRIVREMRPGVTP
jgi:glycosyltransferase involved in cell wall biosynthesis